MAERTFFVEPPHPTHGTTFIKGGDAYHLYKVLRKRIGDTVHCLDRGGLTYQGKIVAIQEIPSPDSSVKKAAKTGLKDKRAWSLTLQLTTQEVSNEPTAEKLPELTVWISMPHPRTLASLTAKLSECGVYALQPILTERSFFQDPRKINLLRLRKIAEEAQKHSGRKDCLKVNTPHPLSELLSSAVYKPLLRDPSVTNILLWENEPYRSSNQTDSTHIFSEQLRKQALKQDPKQATKEGFSTEDFSTRKINLVIGPEGGITFAEHAALTEAGFTAASLHPYILKVETAVLFAVAQCFAL